MRFRLATCFDLLSIVPGILQNSTGPLAPHSPVRKRSGSMLLGSDRERGRGCVKSYLSPEMIVCRTRRRDGDAGTRGRGGRGGRGDTETRGRGDAGTRKRGCGDAGMRGVRVRFRRHLNLVKSAESVPPIAVSPRRSVLPAHFTLAVNTSSIR